MKEKISIIMPIYNSERYLIKSIESVINQSYKNWELICVDDCSSDKSKILLSRFRLNKKIKFFYQKRNFGPAICRNIGLDNAKGTYICFLDSDDYWDVNKLRDQLRFMKRYNHKFSSTNYGCFKNEKIFFPKINNYFNFNQFVNDTSICTSSMMIKKKIIKRTRFNSNFRFDDYLFKCDLLKKENCYNLNKNLTYYRLNNNSVSSDKIRNVIDVWRINHLKNKFNFLKNVKSIINISIRSLIKYRGFK